MVFLRAWYWAEKCFLHRRSILSISKQGGKIWLLPGDSMDQVLAPEKAYWGFSILKLNQFIKLVLAGGGWETVGCTHYLLTAKRQHKVLNENMTKEMSWSKVAAKWKIHHEQDTGVPRLSENCSVHKTLKTRHWVLRLKASLIKRLSMIPQAAPLLNEASCHRSSPGPINLVLTTCLSVLKMGKWTDSKGDHQRDVG